MERLKEEIKFWTEIFRALEVALFGLTGGTVGLVLGEYSLLRVMLSGAGFAGIIGVGIGLYHLQRRIRGLIDQIKEG